MFCYREVELIFMGWECGIKLQSKLLCRLAFRCLKYLAGITIAWRLFSYPAFIQKLNLRKQSHVPILFILDSWEKKAEFLSRFGAVGKIIIIQPFFILFASNLRRKLLFRKSGSLFDRLATSSPEKRRKKNQVWQKDGSVYIGIKLA